MPTLPAFQFYPGDWMKDTQVSKCAPATRGIWFDAICAMHDSDRSGTLSGFADQLARVLRCSLAELHTAIADLKSTKAADVTERNGEITLICRRMQREYLERVRGRERQQKHRGNGEVTPTSSSSPSSSLSLSEREKGMQGGEGDRTALDLILQTVEKKRKVGGRQ